MEQGKYYHIYNRGTNRQRIFFEPGNYDHFLRLFEKYLSGFVSVYAYCLMPNHFHFLIRVDEFENQYAGKSRSIIHAFKYFFMSYAKGINHRFNRTGALLQQKYKRKEITDERYFTKIILYIHQNPVKAGLCFHPGVWAYSSYRIFTGSKHSSIKKKEVLQWFGGMKYFTKAHLMELHEEKNPFPDAWQPFDFKA